MKGELSAEVISTPLNCSSVRQKLVADANTDDNDITIHETMRQPDTPDLDISVLVPNCLWSKLSEHFGTSAEVSWCRNVQGPKCPYTVSTQIVNKTQDNLTSLSKYSL